MTSNSYLDPSTSVYLNKKTVFSASLNLATIRSEGFIRPHYSHQVDPWNLKPPDFSPKLYTSLSVPRRKKTKNTHHPLLTLASSETVLSVDRFTPNILIPEIDQNKKALPKFSTSYRPPGSLESKLMFVKTGKYPPVAYKNPKPRNFRQLADDMPNMVTAAERDPGQLNFKSQHLSIIRGTRSDTDIYSREPFGKMDTYKPTEPRWEARLTLPKLPWPPKSASYTRHRHRRGVYSAFMDRVEEKISSSWKTG
ncbi:putative uncharacterized protein C7orf78 homolog [Oncorhynchus kisutch]|uniref:putative uncharacterized protein C7orf78 homolog n=1 Tax=Oncorhynchus kisutch TaxID=8019 RepID=UPI0012DC359F|nr:uncharacterized protein LOC116376702 [Oncorhynchus kisutch]